MDYSKVIKSFVNGELDVPVEQARMVLEEARRLGIPIKEYLTQHAIIDEYRFLAKAAEVGGVEFTELNEDEVSEEAIAVMPARLVSHYHIMPVSLENGALTIAVDDPFRQDMPEELNLLLEPEVDFKLAPKDSIRRAIRKYYGVGADTVERLTSQENLQEVESQEAFENLDDEHAAQDASVIRLLNQIFIDAIEQRVTDIHFECYESELRIRYRVDGLLREVAVPPSAKHFRHAIISRAKIIANLNIAEHRLPQDGRAQVNLAGQTYDLRISILPTPHGEALNVRILSRGVTIEDLDALGFVGRDKEELLKLIRKPHGILLVTGPTGSGKTTTLYTVLSYLNKAETKILTVEDPIEYRMRGVTQMQANPEIGFTFARALRSMLRHDPDVMLIGEIRDYETAEIAIRSALTGHMVFSTLHTNDAPTAIGRLIDMGVEPFLIASSVEGVLAQRLVRMICPQCKEYRKPDNEMIVQLGSEADQIEKIASGNGCRECRFTGYWGRTCITEFMLMDRRIREMVTTKCNSDEIRVEAMKQGMQPLRQSGIHKMIKGLTTIEEVLRVTPSIESEKEVEI